MIFYGIFLLLLVILTVLSIFFYRKAKKEQNTPEPAQTEAKRTRIMYARPINREIIESDTVYLLIVDKVIMLYFYPSDGDIPDPAIIDKEIKNGAVILHDFSFKTSPLIIEHIVNRHLGITMASLQKRKTVEDVLRRQKESQ